MYQSYFTSGPIPANAPVEGHGVQRSLWGWSRSHLSASGRGQSAALWEMWQGQLQAGRFLDRFLERAMAECFFECTHATRHGNVGCRRTSGGTAASQCRRSDRNRNAAAPNGTVQHPTRFTMNHGLNYWVWPATQSAGVGSCSASSGSISTESLDFAILSASLLHV